MCNIVSIVVIIYKTVIIERVMMTTIVTYRKEMGII